jgi:hypothetical protein
VQLRGQREATVRELRRIIGFTSLTLALAASVAAPASASGVTRPSRGELPAGSVGGASVSLTTQAAGAAKVVYTAGFTTSSGGALATGSGTVTLAGPAGTVFDSDEATYQFHDVTSGATGSEFGFQGTVSAGGATMTVPVPISIAAGDHVTIAAFGVTNPPGAGSRQLAVSTSSDTTAAEAGYALVAPSPATAPSVGLSTTAAGATQVAYQVAFTASKTGGLAPDTVNPAFAGDVVLSAPAGTVFDHNLANYEFRDLTAGRTGNSFGFQGTISRAGATISMPVPIAIAPGDRVSVTAQGTASPSGAGPRQLAVSTSSDTPAVSAGYKLTAPLRVRGLQVTPSFIQAGAPGAVYTIGLTTSGSGALEENGVITVSGPAGTVFPADSADYCVQSGGAVGCTPVVAASLPASGHGSVVRISVFKAIPPGTPVVLTITPVTNASAAGTRDITVSTSSDTVAVSTPFQLVPWSGAEITGTVSFQGAPESGVQLLTCPVAGTPGSCESDVTDSNGTFVEPIGFGTFAITATPASGIGAAAATVQVAVTPANKIISRAITLQKPPGLPPGTGFTANGHTYGPGQVPQLFWEGPSSFTTTGPKNSYGVVVVSGTNPVTGARQVTPAALLETPPGSGKYTATIPAMYPVHGAVTVRAFVLPRPSFPPTPTDFRGGTVSGGTRLFAVVHGNAAKILFGGKPGTGLQQVAPGLYTVVSPAGAGKVPITAVISSARAGLASASDVSLGDWTYLAPPALSSNSGPGDGGATITITGSGLGSDPMVFFGGGMSREVTQTGPDTYSVSVPPGEGTDQVHVVDPGVGYVDAGTYTRTTTPEDLVTQQQNYWDNMSFAATMAEFVNGALISPGKGAYTGLIEAMAEPAITYVTGYKFVSGPAGILQGAVMASLLAEGWECVALYMAFRVLANEIDKGAFASFAANIDPSGTVVDRSGRPVAGARATLQIRSGAGGLFEAVAASSTGISPHVNPETTGKDGRFDWLAAAGVYRVHAASAGCLTVRRQPSAGNTATFTLPPPAVGLVIVLPCQLGKAVRPRITGLSPRAVPAGGGPVLVTGTGIGAAAKVTLGGHPVAFRLLGAGLLQITAPPGAGSRQVIVTAPSGTSTSAPGAAALRYLPVVVPPALDVTSHGVSLPAASAIAAPRFTTLSPGDLVLAFISASGPAGKAQRVTAVTGGGLRWTLVARSDRVAGTVEVWQARANGTLQAAAVTARLLYKAQGSITVAAITGAARATAAGGGSRRGAPAVVLPTPVQSSMIWAVGRDASFTAAVKPVPGQSLVYLDRLSAGAGTGWVQVARQVTGATRVRVADSAPTTVPWELVAVAITPVT